MEVIRAIKAIESLRKGIPPEGLIEHLTVGRSSELAQLHATLDSGDSTAFLIKANYGAGKSHLLRYIREYALSRGYAVSSVTVDTNSAARFNRMDQILGSVCRGIEIPGNPPTQGIRGLFDLVARTYSGQRTATPWTHISNNGRWDYSEILEAPATFVALRAWLCGTDNTKDLIEGLLTEPWNYRTQRKLLYFSLVENLRSHFRDLRPEWKFYADEVFMFHTQGYAQSWAMLRDINSLVRAAGTRGLIILFDEFEDVLTNMRNSQHQDQAFWNLFHFFEGKRFTSRTFFAVTPEFASKAEAVLHRRASWTQGAFAGSTSLADLPSVEMSPLTENNLHELARRIMSIHSVAYSWNAASVADGMLSATVEKTSRFQLQDRTRFTITSVLKTLDEMLQGTE